MSEGRDTENIRLLLVSVGVLSLMLVLSLGLISWVDDPYDDVVMIEYYGDDVDAVSDSDGVVAYVDLSDAEKSEFRGEQKNILDGEEPVVVTRDTSLFEGVEYVTLDGEVYSVMVEEDHSFNNVMVLVSFFVVLVSLSLLLFGGLLVGKGVEWVGEHASDGQFSVLSWAGVFVIVFGGLVIVSLTGGVDVVTLQSVDSVGDGVDVVMYSELSEDERSSFLHLVSSELGMSLSSSLDDGMVIQSNDEYYMVSYHTDVSVLINSVIVFMHVFLWVLVVSSVRDFDRDGSDGGG